MCQDTKLNKAIKACYSLYQQIAGITKSIYYIYIKRVRKHFVFIFHVPILELRLHYFSAALFGSKGQ